jgi:hypothetical protein
LQINDEVPVTWQVAPFIHGLLEQTDVKILQLVPEYWLGHMQMYPLPETWQVAPFKHGLFEQALAEVWQLAPEYPVGQMQI